jgi:hypothetical protein
MLFWRIMFILVMLAGITAMATYVIEVLLAVLSTWKKGKNNNYVYMKFKQWRELYGLNPEKWYADSDNPYRCIYTDGYHKNIYVRFSFFGTACYMIWQSQAEKRKKQARSNAELQLLLRAAQNDIEKLRAQSERELAEAKARTEQVRSQLEKEK